MYVPQKIQWIWGLAQSVVSGIHWGSWNLAPLDKKGGAVAERVNENYNPVLHSFCQILDFLLSVSKLSSPASQGA